MHSLQALAAVKCSRKRSGGEVYAGLNVTAVKSAALEEIAEEAENDPELGKLLKEKIRPRKGASSKGVTEEYLKRKIASTKSELRSMRGIRIPCSAYWSTSTAKLVMCCDPVS